MRPANVELRRAAASEDELPLRWLLCEWPDGADEPVKYWLSNLPADTPLKRAGPLAKLRWRIEHDYRELKDALGLDHFEGRSYRGWNHHVTLVSVAHAFLTSKHLRLEAAPEVDDEPTGEHAERGRPSRSPAALSPTPPEPVRGPFPATAAARLLARRLPDLRAAAAARLTTRPRRTGQGPPNGARGYPLHSSVICGRGPRRAGVPRARSGSSWPGSRTRRPAPRTWSGCAGLRGSCCEGCGARRGWRTGQGRFWVCAGCARKTSVTAGTIFDKTRTPLTEWFAAAVVRDESEARAVSEMGLKRALGLGSYQTAWMMLHRFRVAMVRPGRERLAGRVEVDETYVGGEEEGVAGRQTDQKSIVAIAVEVKEPEDSGRARLQRVPDVSAASLVLVRARDGRARGRPS